MIKRTLYLFVSQLFLAVNADSEVKLAYKKEFVFYDPSRPEYV